jgi:cytoskeletal protein RodZ
MQNIIQLNIECSKVEGRDMKRNNQKLEHEQATYLAEMGAYLRDRRHEMMLSLDQVASTTLIRASLLRAIESGNLDDLPEPVYIRGLVKRYADALGLNGVEFAEAFPINVSARSVYPSWKDSPAAQLRPLHLYVAYIALIVTAISSLSHVVSQSNAPSVTPIPVPAQVNPNANSPAVSSADPTSRVAEPVSDKPVYVEVTMVGQSWMRVEVDGKTAFEGVLSEGSRRTWEADSEVTVRAGNAGGVMVTYNGSQAEPMGEPGAVEEVTYTAAAGDRSAADPQDDITAALIR